MKKERVTTGKYICHAQGIEQFDYQRNSLGIGKGRALYYSKEIGKGRIYRSEYPNTPVKHANDFLLLEFDNKRDAFVMCNKINAAYNDVFKPLYIL